MSQPMQGDYTDAEWADSTSPLPLQGQSAENLLILHRAWLWANVQRECGDKELTRIVAAHEPLEEHLDPGCVLQSHYFAFYGFLYSLIEGCRKRRIDLRGHFHSDVDAMKGILKPFRNAVFHVPWDRYHDDRLSALFLSAQTSADRIRRVHRGFGRLFLEEFARRTPKP